MSKNDKVNNEGYNMLARAIQARAQKVGEAPPLLDFGVIQGDMSLLTNKFPLPIPQTDYFVCRQLTIGETDDVLTKTQYIGKPNDGRHDHAPCGAMGATGHSQEGAHRHDVLIPEKMRWIKPGDHVLVAWVDSDPVVIDLILPATEVG